ncbi:MAG: alpha/beta hydrolase family protein [Acidimicrobiales bacterium]
MRVSSDRPVPVWFGSKESPLFGVLHTPDGPTRAVIVLCPPLGREYAYSHSTFLRLATRLSQVGFAALRFDYRSTGDSFERIAEKPDECGFADDVRLAVEFARTLGTTRVGIVGMRLGANFTSVQIDLEPVDAVVLWDPCPTGRSFLREQRALALFAGVRVADNDVDVLDLPGFKVSPAMADEILRLDLLAGSPGSAEMGQLSDKVLLLTRSERVVDRKLVERFDLPHVERKQVLGQRELLDVHDDWPIVPAEGLATVVSWLDEVMPRTGSALAIPNSREVAVGICAHRPGSPDVCDGDRTIIRERAVWLGPVGLFGIETEREPSFGPVCVFLSVANEHRPGPGRLWVHLSRDLAAAGFRCVRVDINGFGDSPARDGQLDQPVHMISAIDDVLDVAKAVSPGNPGDVVMFGLCSSGYQILEASVTLVARGVCALNPSLIFRPPEMESGAKMDDRRLFCLPEDEAVIPPREKKAVEWLKKQLPTFALLLARGQRALVLSWRQAIGRYRKGPGRRVLDLVESGTDVLLICGQQEIRPFLRSGLGPVARANRKDHLRIEVIPTLDHGLFPLRDREQVADLILAHVIAEFHAVPDADEDSVAWRAAHSGVGGS